MKRLYQCIKNKKVNQSQAREAIYRVFLENEEKCMSVADIRRELSKVYTKKVSLNTIYRHLDLFVSCNLAVVIQDDFKKAYYCLTGDEPLAFTICRKCNRVKKIAFHPEKCDETLEDTDFITIHKKCEKCS
ncbi:transcriptional repressor [Sulfurovum sp.]|uniref:Fur family transcriptional regulator n=1 Tax=Sulfurovum sp. TaxID=1969726 RepID=UPI0025D4D48F|nr:transcriptional repressor [Sulfurovum sp.]